MTDLRLSADLAESVLVLRLDLDGGPVYLTGAAARRWGGVAVRQGVLSFGSVEAGTATIELAAEALPAGAWIAGRRVRAWRCLPGTGWPESGHLVLDGRAEHQPDEDGQVLTLRVGRTLYAAPATVPALGVVTAGDWPRAAEGTEGKPLPALWGTVERAPLLPVQVGRLTRLRATARPGDDVLAVDDVAEWPDAGTVAVDGQTYTYTAREPDRLLGVAVVDEHAVGTAVHEPLPWIYKAAGEAVSAIDAVRAENTAVTPSATDLTAATVTFGRPPHRERVGELSTLYAQFDQVTPASTALEGVNAIQAAVGQETQTATNLPLTVVGGTRASVTFARPEPVQGTDTIIGAAYGVSLSVAAGNDCEVTIGGRVAYVRRNGVVLYHPEPLEWLAESDSDELPVSIAVAEGVDASTISVTVTAASRLVVLGNRDATAYAQLRTGGLERLAVRQTDAMADRGRIRRALLMIDWQPTDALLSAERLEAYWNGQLLGQLRMQTSGSTTESLSFDFDLSQAGHASLQPTDLTTNVAGGTASLYDVPLTQRTPVALQYGHATPYTGITIYAGVTRFAPPPTVRQGQVVTGKLYFSDYGSPCPNVMISTSTGFSVTLSSGIGPGAVRSFGFVAPGPTGWVRIHHGDYLTTADFNEGCRIVTADIDWPITPIGQQNTPAYGGTTIRNNALPLSGRLSQDKTLTQAPRDARSVVSQFDLPVTNWADLTNTTAEVVLTSSRSALTVMVFRALLAIEHEPVSREPAPVQALTATVTGRSANPADVVADLAAAAGERLAPGPLRRARAWFDAEGWRLARRLDVETEARQMLYELVDHLGCHLLEADDGLALVRALDVADPLIVEIRERDLFVTPRITWSTLDSRTNALTLRWRLVDGQPTRAVVRDAGTDPWAALGRRQTGVTLASEIVSQWAGDATTAAGIASTLIRLRAPLRRTADLTLTGRYALIRPGRLLSWRGALWRVETARAEGTTKAITATEIPRMTR